MKFKLVLMFGVLIITFTGCNGKSSDSKNGAIPITMDNIQLYTQKKNQASQSVSLRFHNGQGYKNIQNTS